jgi:hypothetical protein
VGGQGVALTPGHGSAWVDDAALLWARKMARPILPILVTDRLAARLRNQLVINVMVAALSKGSALIQIAALFLSEDSGNVMLH